VIRLGRAAFGVVALACGAACVGSTGADLVAFSASAAGAPGVRAGTPFATGRGYVVTLERATMHVGAVYLSRSAPISGGQERECYASGGYVGEVLVGRRIDLLSSEPQAFEGGGRGIRERARSCEVWLTGGRVDEEDDKTVVFDAKGVATRGVETIPFEARFTIGKNRAAQNDDPTRPGASPLCSVRIVSPIACDIVPDAGGELRVAIDVRSAFANVEFTELDPSTAVDGVRRFRDVTEGQPNVSLFAGIRAASGTFIVKWEGN